MSANHWSNGLIKTLKDPASHIISSNLAVVISDKFPKAKHHYLVLPQEEIPSIFNLNGSHLTLLKEMHLMAINVLEVKQLKECNFLIGFHNQPSMQRLHMHVISKDFVSVCLKRKQHWNGFNTELFLTYDDAIAQLQETNGIKRLDSVTLRRLSNTELKCNQCSFVAKNISNLKQHLLQHTI